LAAGTGQAEPNVGGEARTENIEHRLHVIPLVACLDEDASDDLLSFIEERRESRRSGCLARAEETMNKSSKIGKAWMGAALTAIALVCVQPAVAQIGIVSVTGGRIEGVTADGITSFKGIPFAAPPVGNLRWRVPQSVRSWTGIRKADQFRPECMQPTFRRPGAQSAPVPSEDCLYLNVWTAAKSADARLPVMVWIYGGSFMGGSGSQPGYDGTHFAQKGVVLVNLNYRLGVFGFLADHELDAESPHHVSGNYGLGDMIAALKWVRANIAQFGGDPSRVTVFGESAGGLAVGILSVSPAARGLFQRAISESAGAPLSPAELGDASYSTVAPFPSLTSAEDIGQRFLAKLGAQDIAAARSLPAEALLKAQPSVSPVHDDYILPGDAYQRFHAGRFNDTPILVGTNANEGAFRPFRAQFAGTTPEKFETRIRAAFGKYADEILAAYPHATPAEAEQASEDLFFRDTALAWKTWAWARLQSEAGHDKAYLYYFDRRSPQEPLGPAHTEEIPYVFGNVGQTPTRGFGPPGPAGPVDVSLSQQMQSYWVNFAKSGDPNGPGLPHWPAFSASSPRAMYLDDQPHAGPVPNLSKLDVLDAYFNWLRPEDKK
jgi:para-nitrobenzyl esterase